MRTRNRSETGNRSGLHGWYREPLGTLFGEAEKTCLATTLASLFGQHIIALGTALQTDLLAASPISQRYYLDCVRPAPESPFDIWSEFTCLPIAGNCIDVAVLPHVLESTPDPQAILMEIDRILNPEGHVLILGFNPFSVWGLRRLLSWRSGHPPWNTRFRSVTQLRHRLAQLGFETLAVTYYFYRPPLKHKALLEKLAVLEQVGAKGWPFAGAGYLLLAKKRVATLTPIRLPWWRPGRYWLPAGLANNSLRNRRCDHDC